MFYFLESPATLILLLLNLLVSGLALFQDPSLVGRLAFVPHRILKEREYYRLFTAGFVHVSLGHLAFNMLTLYFFGPELERLLGTGRFVILYVGSELAAHALSLVIHRDSVDYSAVGASGAISGVLFAFCLFRPFDKILLFGVVPMWSIVFAVGYVVLSVYAINQRQKGRDAGRIAHEAHLGGALGGLLLTILLEPRALEIFLRQLGF